MSLDHPTYYAESSVMNQAGMGLGFGFSLNPGLGFRPQIDPEDHQIIYNPKNYESHYSDENGFRQYSDNMRIFLEHSKYQLFNNSSNMPILFFYEMWDRGVSVKPKLEFTFIY